MKDSPKVVGFIDPSVLKVRMRHSRKVRRDKKLSFSLGSKLGKAIRESRNTQ